MISPFPENDYTLIEESFLFRTVGIGDTVILSRSAAGAKNLQGTIRHRLQQEILRRTKRPLSE